MRARLCDVTSDIMKVIMVMMMTTNDIDHDDDDVAFAVDCK